MPPDTEQLVEFFKTLANESRLKIIGLLALQPRSVDELAAMLKLTAPTVSNHLQYLAHTGLVEARAEQHYHMYSLIPGVLNRMAKELLSTETIAEATTPAIDQDAYARKIIGRFVVDGRIRQFPSQFKKMQVLVAWCAGLFEPGQVYTEKEVNEILKARHPDFATLRRELVDAGHMARKDGRYWRLPQRAGAEVQSIPAPATSPQ